MNSPHESRLFSLEVGCFHLYDPDRDIEELDTEMERVLVICKEVLTRHFAAAALEIEGREVACNVRWEEIQ